MAHIRQSRPDSGPGFNVRVFKTFELDPPSLGRGALFWRAENRAEGQGRGFGERENCVQSLRPFGDTSPCRMTRVTLNTGEWSRSVVRERGSTRQLNGDRIWHTQDDDRIQPRVE